MSGFLSKNVQELGSQVPDFMLALGWVELWLSWGFDDFMNV